MTSFYMTDFLCRQFDAFFMRPLKLDRHPELIKDFFGNSRRSSTSPRATIRTRPRRGKCGQLLGLAYERRSTGYGDLTPR